MTYLKKKGKVPGLLRVPFYMNIILLCSIWFSHLSVSPKSRFLRVTHLHLILGSNYNDSFAFLPWILENSI